MNKQNLIEKKEKISLAILASVFWGIVYSWTSYIILYNTLLIFFPVIEISIVKILGILFSLGILLCIVIGSFFVSNSYKRRSIRSVLFFIGAFTTSVILRFVYGFYNELENRMGLTHNQEYLLSTLFQVGFIGIAIWYTIIRIKTSQQVLDTEGRHRKVPVFEFLEERIQEEGALNYGRIAFLLNIPRFLVFLLNGLCIGFQIVIPWQFFFMFGLYLDISIIILGKLGCKNEIQKFSAIVGIVLTSLIGVYSLILNIEFLWPYISSHLL